VTPWRPFVPQLLIECSIYIKFDLLEGVSQICKDSIRTFDESVISDYDITNPSDSSPQLMENYRNEVS
jgi:hypothetical protein